MQDESSLISKGPCSSCGSSDANALYDDGHSFCFSCNTHTNGASKVERVSLTSDGELGRLVEQWSRKQAASVPERSLKSASMGKYGVSVSDTHHAYPYFKEGQTEPVAFKVRDVKNKAFRVVGQLKEAGLFGQNLWGNYDRKRVVITEGELDAIATQQMLNNSDAVVSLRGGAAAAARDLKDNYTFIDGFKEVVLCFDADAAGQDAVAKACDIFAGKVRVMKLDPTIGKDACDYLRAGKADEFANAFWTAPLHVPEGITDVDELWKELTAEKPRAIGEYPWKALNKLTYGFRPTELTTLCAGSGLGKTAILREVIMHLKATTDHRIGTLFMEESVSRTAEGFMGIDLNTPLHLPTSRIKNTDEEYKQSYDRTIRDQQIVIMNAAFDTGATVEDIIGRVRYLIKAMDCKVIVLDHISILVSAGQHNDERKALDEIMTRLRAMSQDTGVCIFAVSHLKRPEGKGHEDGAVTSVSQLRGSAAIAQLSDFVIGLERNGQAECEIERNTTQIRVLKNRFSGMTGPAGCVLYNPETGRLSEYEPQENEADIL